MIILDCLQRSEEWFRARRGIPTASAFAKLITKEGKPRKGLTPERYVASLVQEIVTGEGADTCETWSMQRGVMLEPHARAWYEIYTERKVTTAGFVYGDETRAWGCSPDGLVKNGASVVGGIEIKCPLNIIHPMLFGLDEDYVIQAQGEMWICGAAWWDVVVYTEGQDENPRGTIFKLLPNPVLHAAFAQHIPAFAAQVASLAKDTAATLAKYPRIPLTKIADKLGPEWARAVVNNGDVDINRGGNE